MSTPAVAPVRRIPIGAYCGVSLDVAAWDAVGAQVDLSFASLFAHESGSALVGGLLHLDTALGGALLLLRAGGVFRAEVMETMLLTILPHPIQAKALMVIGLGEPEAWRPELMGSVTRCAVSEAARLGAASASFAPGLLDSGLPLSATPNSGDAMLMGVVRGIDASHRLAEIGLANPLSLKRWTFGAGAAHLDAVADQFGKVLASMPNPE